MMARSAGIAFRQRSRATDRKTSVAMTAISQHCASVAMGNVTPGASMSRPARSAEALTAQPKMDGSSSIVRCRSVRWSRS